MYDLIIHNACTGPYGLEPCEIAIEGGKFAEVSESVSGPASRELDAEGLLALPGVVDAHVHFNEPGRTAWEGWATGSRAAAAGGVTSLIEMPLNSIPSTLDAASFNEKAELAASKSLVDFGLWGGLTPVNLDKLEELAEAGVVAFKAFLSPSGTDDFQNVDWDSLEKGMATIAKLGRVLGIHSEDPSLLGKPKPGTGQPAHAWEAARPVEAELAAVQRIAEMAQASGCPVHIVHVSHPDVVDLISELKRNGVDITCETCPHYLQLTTDDAEAIGPDAKCAPPLRIDALPGLWVRLASGKIDTVGSDHSPCTSELKEAAFLEAWGGISGIQQLLLASLTAPEGCMQPTPEVLASVLSAAPAKRFCLGAHKGKLAPGYDADFVLFDPKSQTTVTRESLHYRNPRSAYIGKNFRGCIAKTFLRGKQIYPFTGEPPRGRLLRPMA